MLERLVVGPMRTNSYIFSVGKKECIVVDPGGDTDVLIARMDEMNLKPVGVILTHGHIDHCAGLSALVSEYIARGIDLQIAIHSLDRDYIGKNAEETHRQSLRGLGLEGEHILRELFDGMPETDILLSEGDEVFHSGLVVIHTPGHTEGSVCLYHEGQGLLLSGDTLFFKGIGRSDLPGGNTDLLLSSLRTKILILPDETRVFPGHGPDTTIERERHSIPSS